MIWWWLMLLSLGMFCACCSLMWTSTNVTRHCMLHFLLHNKHLLHRHLILSLPQFNCDIDHVLHCLISVKVTITNHLSAPTPTWSEHTVGVVYETTKSQHSGTETSPATIVLVRDKTKVPQFSSDLSLNQVSVHSSDQLMQTLNLWFLERREACGWYILLFFFLSFCIIKNKKS